MDLVPWQPWREFERLRNTIDRVFLEPFAAPTLAAGVNLRVPVEVLERADELVVRAEVPGIDPQDLDVRITDEGVTLRGERKQAADADRDGIRHSERFYGAFMRHVAFPAPVDAARARATFRNGVLEVRAPRRHPDEGRDGRRLPIEPH